MAVCTFCKREMNIPGGNTGCVPTPFGTTEDKYDPIPAETACGDCGCKAGTYHHPGCDREVCPRCRRQAIGCGCFADDDD